MSSRGASLPGAAGAAGAAVSSRGASLPGAAVSSRGASLPGAAGVVPGPAGVGRGAPSALRLLIVDDDAPVGRALARIARGLGWVVDPVTSWREGQLLLRRARYDLLLVDYGLGGEVTGAEVIAWAQRAYRALPAALMSGGEYAVAAAAAIGCPMLLKPFSRDELAALLDAAATAAAHAAAPTAALAPAPGV